MNPECKKGANRFDNEFTENQIIRTQPDLHSSSKQHARSLEQQCNMPEVLNDVLETFL